MRTLAVLLTSALAIVSCAALPPLDPVTSRSLTVQPAVDTARTLTVKAGMVFYSNFSRTHGVRFPPGTYVLEAEDNDYWYFRAPAPLEFRDFQNGAVTSAKDMPGGIMIPRTLGKSLQALVAGAGYADGENSTTRNMVWKLGGEFRRLEGTEWTKSF
jgi:hypothetical protein